MVQIHGSRFKALLRKTKLSKIHSFTPRARVKELFTSVNVFFTFAMVLFCLSVFHNLIFNSRYFSLKRKVFSCFFSEWFVTGWFQHQRQNIMQPKEIQAFIDCAWEEKGVFVHIDPDLPACILTSKGALGKMPSAPKTILARNLDEAISCLSVLFPD